MFYNGPKFRPSDDSGAGRDHDTRISQSLSELVARGVTRDIVQILPGSIDPKRIPGNFVPSHAERGGLFLIGTMNLKSLDQALVDVPEITLISKPVNLRDHPTD